MIARMKSSAATVHVVDDDESVRKSLSRLISEAGYRVQAYTSAGEFLARTPEVGPSCLVLDVRMPGATGLELQQTWPPRPRDPDHSHGPRRYLMAARR